MLRRLKLVAVTIAGLTAGVAVWQAPPFDLKSLAPQDLIGTMKSQLLVDYGWQSVGDEVKHSAGIKVENTESDGVRLVFELPGFGLKTVAVDGRPCSRVDVPGLVKLKVADLPEVPIVSTTLAVQPSGEVQFKVIDHVVREVRVKPVEPSKGHLTRDIDPATVVARFGAFYEDGGVWPPAPVIMSETFLLQDQRGVTLRFNPLRYDAGRGVLLVSERLVVEVIGAGGQDKASAGYPVEFASVRESVFGTSLSSSADKYQAVPTLGRMLIIAPEALATAVTPLVHWKRQRGIPADLVTVPNVGVTTAEIAGLITTAYHEPDGLVWVILVGDRAEMPPAVGQYDGSDSDTRYAMVSGDDLYPDLFISRLSATTPTQVSTQVNKFIAYEKMPSTGVTAAWYGRAVAVASDEGVPADFERADLLRTDLITYGFGPVDQIYQNQGGTTALIAAALNSGASLVNYLGHGTGYGWESVPFRQYDLAALSNSNRLPWIIDVSCDNGDIALDDCFAESWLRAGTPTVSAGAVGMIAASSLAPWVPPTVMQAEVVDLLTTGEAFTLGALCYSGLMQVADHYAGIWVAEQVIEQNILFGDCSLMVRTAEPGEYAVDCPTTLPREAVSLWLDVTGPVGSVVTLTHAGELYATATVAAGGVVELPLGSWTTALIEVDVTITGFNMVPWIATVLLAGQNQVSAVETPMELNDVKLMGNFPNPFNPSTRVTFELPRDTAVSLKVYNIRGELVRDLSAGQMSAGTHEVLWNGQDRRGQRVSSGVYLYKLEAAGQVLSGRMLMSQ